MDRLGLICRTVLEDPKISQRDLAQRLNISLGSANGLLKEAMERGMIMAPQDSPHAYGLTAMGMDYLRPYRVDGAVILAAGFGSRFVPLTFDTPKGLLEVFGERMIERQIKQLHEAGIFDITIVVGYLKEKFEYLIDKYEVSLLYNPEYSTKNNLATIYHARKLLAGRNMYVLASDNWMRHNMFHAYECGAWYSSVFMEGATSEWALEFNKKGLITAAHVGGQDCWVMYGPIFFSKEFSEVFLPEVEAYYQAPGTEQLYWEQAYMDHIARFPMYVNRQPEGQVYEFENLEELRLFDPRYQNNSDNEALQLVAKVFEVPESDIRGIRCLKAGMTNRSFLFEVKGELYICRIPGEGTEYLINRQQEAAVYEAVKPLGITETVIYMDGKTGYKIAVFHGQARNADASDWEDMERCMAVLRSLHGSGLTVGHSFDLRERIDYYISLCKGSDNIPFEDFKMVYQWMDRLLTWLGQLGRPQQLCHIDGVCDNFLFLEDGRVRLIDWEYAAMGDPLLDIALSGIYSYYDEGQIVRLLELYLGRAPKLLERKIVYAYVALGGFLWCLWAVYKSSLGVEFGEYTIINYRYAKQFYRKVWGLGIG